MKNLGPSHVWVLARDPIFRVTKVMDYDIVVGEF